jgi:hypothetical protein
LTNQTTALIVFGFNTSRFGRPIADWSFENRILT